jgi:hypothetical protein
MALMLGMMRSLQRGEVLFKDSTFTVELRHAEGATHRSEFLEGCRGD